MCPHSAAFTVHLACLGVLQPQAPTEQVMFFAGVDRAEVEALGSGALLVLALPVWNGWLYTSLGRWDMCVAKLQAALRC